MNEFKGTPGPWIMTSLPIELRNTDSAAAIYKDTRHGNEIGSALIADLSRSVGDEQSTANAHLIAAAPDLLEALEILLFDFKSVVKSAEYQPSVIIANEAIKKALNIQPPKP